VGVIVVVDVGKVGDGRTVDVGVGGSSEGVGDGAIGGRAQAARISRQMI
jgi:hypothetical protein